MITTINARFQLYNRGSGFPLKDGKFDPSIKVANLARALFDDFDYSCEQVMNFTVKLNGRDVSEMSLKELKDAGLFREHVSPRFYVKAKKTEEYKCLT